MQKAKVAGFSFVVDLTFLKGYLEGKFTEVIDYCLADCHLTGKMFSAASADGSILCAPSKSSKEQVIPTDSWNLWMNSQNVLNR